MISGNVLLPPKKYRKGPKGNLDDGTYIRKAQLLVNSIAVMSNISDGRVGNNPDFFSKARILDIGCGPLRLITGMQASGVNYEKYTGIDVDQSIITWASEKFGDERHDFQCIDMKNARYNPEGKKVTDLVLPVSDSLYTLVTLRSVFTHMNMHDMELYLPEINRKLDAKGKLYLSVYVEEGHVLKAHNLEEYNATPEYGPLHKQMVSRQWFEQALDKHGFEIACYSRNILNQPTYLAVKR